MGTAQQLLKWEDSTLLEKAIDTALKLKADEVIVVLGANYNNIKKEIKNYPITVLNNKDWQVGLGRSLAFGVDYLLSSNFKLDGCLVTLADQPLINHVFLSHLITLFQFSGNFHIRNSGLSNCIHDLVDFFQLHGFISANDDSDFVAE